jgi:selenide,water dikinase
MGGRPITVLSVLGFPGQLDPAVMTEILTGSADVVKGSGAVIAGGHTIIDNELKYGLAVTGLVHPEKVVKNSTARPGDRLVLTKPIGTGFITTGIKREVVKDEAVEREVTRVMAALNRGAAEAMMEVGVNAATDITGYGLIGHAAEMADGSGVTLRFRYSDLPRFPGVESLAESCMSGGTSNNRRHNYPKVEFDAGVTEAEQMVLFDAQTSGGLLISVPEERVSALVSALEAHEVETRAVVGEVLPKGEKPIEVTP